MSERQFDTMDYDYVETNKVSVSIGEIKENSLELKENHTGAIIGFPTKRGELVHARVASSFISFEQAELNLQELGNRSFEAIKADGKNRWNERRDYDSKL